MNFDHFVRDIEKNAWNVYGAEVYEGGILTHLEEGTNPLRASMEKHILGI